MIFCFYHEEISSGKICLPEKTYFCWKCVQTRALAILDGQIISRAKGVFFMHIFGKENYRFSFRTFIFIPECIQAELNLMSLHVVQDVPVCVRWDFSQGRLQLLQIVSKYMSFMV